MDFVNRCIVEQGSGSGAEQGNDCVGLATDLLADELFLCSWPDGENTSDCEVVDHYGASIQRIEGDVVAFTLTIKLLQLRSLFTGEPFDQRVFFEVLLNDLVSVHVLLQLGVTELVCWLKNDDGWMPEEYSNLSSGIQNGLDNRSLWTADLWQWVVHFGIVYKITVMGNLDL